MKGHDARDLLRRSILSEVEVVAVLEVQPELGGGTEVLPEAQGCISGDGALAVNDLVDASGRHPDGHGELVLRDLESPDEVLHKNLARMNRRNLARRKSHNSLHPPNRYNKQ